jgi:hypothetical protein
MLVRNAMTVEAGDANFEMAASLPISNDPWLLLSVATDATFGVI